jgi:hypothetical protein
LARSDNAGSSDFSSFIHSAEGASNINFNGQFWRGAEDQGNAFYEFSRRYLINNTFSLMFHDAYGYASVNPAQFGTMYTILQNDGTLLVRGSSAVSNDLIYVDASGSNLVLSVDVGTDVGGTGAFAGDQNLPAFVTVVPISSVSTINVQAGRATTSCASRTTAERRPTLTAAPETISPTSPSATGSGTTSRASPMCLATPAPTASSCTTTATRIRTRTPSTRPR